MTVATTMFKFKMFTRTFKTMFKCVNLLCHNANTLRFIQNKY